MKVDPCPCCRSTDIYVGVTSVMTQGVRCCECGLSLEVSMPSRMPRGCSTMKELYRRMQDTAVRRWNAQGAGSYRIDLKGLSVKKGGGQRKLVNLITTRLLGSGVKIQPGTYDVTITRRKDDE